MLFRAVGLVGAFAFLGAASTDSNIEARGKIRDDPGGHNWIDHDKVKAFLPSYPNDLPTQLALRFNPLLYVEGGCDVYPAVDDAGNLSGGLKPTPKNKRRSGCDAGGQGQVYARLGTTQNRTAIMYSYYMPKVRWGEGDDQGHRSYWTFAIVWLLEFGCSPSQFWPTGLSFTSDHEQMAWSYKTPLSYSAALTQMPTHPKLKLHDVGMGPFTGADGDLLFQRTLVTWDQLPSQARAALNDVRYEHTIVPFSDANFQGLIDAAYASQFYSDAPIAAKSSCLNITEGPHTAPQQPGGQGPGQGQTPGQPPDGTNGGGQPTLPSGYSQIVFEDNYSKQQVGSLPDTSKWDFDLGTGYPGGAPNWGTGEVQTYTNDSANIGISSSGTLVITPMVNNGDWTSSRIQTNAAQDFKCAPGGKLRIEASVMLPDSDPSTQLGIWPAVWSMGSAFRTNVSSWPGIGELDILEVLNGQPKLYQTVHCGVSPGGPCNEKTGLGSNTAIKRGVFNKIAVEVDRSAGGDYTTEQLVWYLNDKATFTVTGKAVGNQAYWEALASEPKMILLNVAVGGEFPDGVQGSKTPTAATVGGPESRMEIAYVAAYST